MTVPGQQAVCVHAAENAKFTQYYYVEPRPGLCFGKNRFLQVAIQHQVDLIAFIDDDEMPHQDWLHKSLVFYY